MIAPAVVLAADPDLQDIGLAYERWWEVPEAIRNIVAGRGSTDLAARVLFGTGYGAVALIRGAARSLRQPWVAVTVFSIAAVAPATRRRWYPQTRRWVEQRGPRMRQVAGSACLRHFRRVRAVLGRCGDLVIGPARSAVHRHPCLPGGAVAGDEPQAHDPYRDRRTATYRGIRARSSGSDDRPLRDPEPTSGFLPGQPQPLATRHGRRQPGYPCGIRHVVGVSAVPLARVPRTPKLSHPMRPRHS